MKSGGLLLIVKIVLDFVACCGLGYWGWNTNKWGVWSALALFILLLLLILGM